MRTGARSAVLAGVLATAACREAPTATEANPDWTEATHGASVAPNYGTVFPQETVPALHIAMTAAQWQRVRNDMKALYGADFGAGGMAAPPGGTMPDPAYIDVTVTFEGKRWTHVGFRLKGNSSLNSAWRAGNWKLPFRLNFDKFEDDFAGIANQRFFGFDELSMSPGFKDQSLIHEKAASDILRRAGLPAARTAFWRVYIDFGAGERYVGVYTMVEVVDDTMLGDQFPGLTGNLYKPESQLASFVASQFEKKNNTALADYADVQAFVAALNSPLRTSAPAQWRAGLEATFDVDHFTRWLAVNTVMVNWDTYGAFAHNYYLFNHPTRRLLWIPWDHNEALTGSPGVTGAIPPPPGPLGLSLSLNEVSVSWPLIRYVADDSLYFARYRAAMRTFVTETFTVAAMDSLLSHHHGLVAPYAVGAQGEQPGATYLTSAAAFTGALDVLKQHVRDRRALVLGWVP